MKTVIKQQIIHKRDSISKLRKSGKLFKRNDVKLVVGDGEGNVQDFEIGDYEDSADNKKYRQQEDDSSRTTF